LIARQEEVERRRIESVGREEQQLAVESELLNREAEQKRRIVDQNARQHE
jgi:hypothetical protein